MQKGKIFQAYQMDASQKAFCNLDAKYIRLLAPAGAGKTMTLLFRCKRLLEEFPQERILIFTFTRVACEELRLRLKSMPDFQKYRANILISTLNSYGLRIVKNKTSLISSYKTIEKKDRIWTVLNNLAPVIQQSNTIAKKMTEKRWRAFNATKILDMIDTFKSLAFDHEALRSNSDFWVYWEDLEKNGLKMKLQTLVEDLCQLGIIHQASDLYSNFFRFYAAATEHLKSMNLYTLEDQKYWGWKYSAKGTKLTGAARYSHILIDEFQDINPIDLYFIKAIRNQHDASLTIVGDDDQAIFEWRGATPQYILHPEKFFRTAQGNVNFETCVLNRNYRSPKNIVEISQKLICHNQNRVEKKVIPVRADSAEIFIRTAAGFDAVANQIIRAWENKNFRNIAVITRKRSQLIPYQIIFASKGIPFFAAEDLNVFLTEAFNSLKDLIEIKQIHQSGYIPSLTYYTDAILKLCDRIRKYPLNKREREALRTHMSQKLFRNFGESIAHLQKFPALDRFFKNNITSILDAFFKTSKVTEMLDFVSLNFAGLQKDFRKADDDIFYADPPFEELSEFSRRYGEEFDRFSFDVQKAILSLSALVSDEDNSNLMEGEEYLSTKLHLMTSLRTKGKEFDSVFILSTNETIWPIRFATTETELEAERRLFYVAITRSKKELNLILDENLSPTPYLVEMGLNV